MLKNYTLGYRIWEYIDYHQSDISNGSFQFVLDEWVTQTGGSGKIMFQDLYLIFSKDINEGDSKYFAIVEKGVKHYPEGSCDDDNKNMQVCFKYRMRGTFAKYSDARCGFHILWDKKQLGNLIIENSSFWTEHCTCVTYL